MRPQILIVDDDQALGDTLCDFLISQDYKAHWVGNGVDALELVKKDSFDIVLLDLKLPGMDGIKILKEILKLKPWTVVIMISVYGTIEKAVEAARLGAYDWLEKPLQMERVLLTVRNAVEKSILLNEKRGLLNELKSRYKMVGVSSPMRGIFSLIDKVALQNTTVLITGESGTGKESIAHAVHINSGRAALPFIKVNCAAIPDTLIESELFGHVRGAFTGAIQEKQGKFQLANQGTILLDEIGDLSQLAQAKLLRTIETGEVVKVGTEHTEMVDVRLIAATNKDLKNMISKGLFREDLFHRINVIEINTPPLRNRPEDILPLAYHFIDLISIEKKLSKKTLTPEAEGLLLSHSWPGNIRELRNFIEKLFVLIDSERITGQHIMGLFQFPKLDADMDGPKTFYQAKKIFERSFILHSLNSNNWNVTKTADSIGMPRSLLYRKMEKYGLKEELHNLE
jgi:two-component system nitrogen regulation response regulator NtrX